MATEEELYQIYLEMGWDDITPFRGLTAGYPEGVAMAEAEWERRQKPPGEEAAEDFDRENRAELIRQHNRRQAAS